MAIYQIDDNEIVTIKETSFKDVNRHQIIIFPNIGNNYVLAPNAVILN